MRNAPSHPVTACDEAEQPSRRHLLCMAGLASVGGLLPSLAHAGPREDGLLLPALATGRPPSLHRTLPGLGNGLRDALLAALNLVPVTGGLLSYLGALFIPIAGETPEERWQRYVDERISSAILALVSADLAGLSEVAALYQSAVSNGDPATIRVQSTSARTVFVATMPRLRLVGYERELLPLFVIAASLHLALLRDMALKGTEIGLNPGDIADLKTDLTARIAMYQAYVDTQVAAALAQVRRDNPNRGTPATRNHPLQPWLVRKAALQSSVLDIRDTWYAFDAERYPHATRVQLPREIHLMAGWWHQSQAAPEKLPGYPLPTSAMTTLELFLSRYRNRLYSAGAICKYADGSVLRSGSILGERVELGITVDAPIDLLRVHYGSVVSQIDVRRGGNERKVGESDTQTDPVTMAPAQHRLSSLRSTGTGRNTNNTHDSGFIAGFQLQQMEAAPMSLEAFDELAPRIAPQLLEWIAG